MLQRLRFNAAQVEVVRVVAPPTIPFWEPGGAFIPLAFDDMLQAEECRARRVVKAVSAELGDAGAGEVVLCGNPTSQLLTRADEVAADLIAVDGHEHTPLGAALLGSVARGLVIGASQSVLLARPLAGAKDRPLRVVLATDHSDYADRCWERLMRFWPRGISHLTALTAYPEDRLKAAEPLMPDLGISPARAVHDQLVARNEALMTRLAKCFPPSCTSIDSVISTLPVHDAITAQMSASEADLLILGAKGHGLLERLTLGSVALREALTCPQSVLVVRA